MGSKFGRLLLVLSLAAGSSELPAGEAEGNAEAALPTVSLSKIQPLLQGVMQESPHYAIDPVVKQVGHNYRFKLNCAQGEYILEVDSVAKLVKACHEIYVIEEFRATEHGSEAWKGAKSAMSDMGDGAKAVVLHPGDSAVGVSRAARKVGRGIERFVDDLFDKDKEKSSTGVDRAKSGDSFLVADQARSFAYRYQLNIYTDNPFVQALIKEIAQERWAGSFGVGIATSVIVPVTGAGFVVNGALTSNGLEDATEQLIRDNNPPELLRTLGKLYREDFDLAKDDKAESKEIAEMLKDPNYSPREQAYNRLFMKYLSALQDRWETLQFIGQASTVTDAILVSAQMELLTALHQNGHPLAKFVRINRAGEARMIGALDDKGTLIAIMPWDLAGATEECLALAADVAKAGKAVSAHHITLWFTGQANSEFVKAAGNVGVDVESLILQKPEFMLKTKGQTLTQPPK